MPCSDSQPTRNVSVARFVAGRAGGVIMQITPKACCKLTPLLYTPCCDDMRRQLEFRCAGHADLSDWPDWLDFKKRKFTYDSGSAANSIACCVLAYVMIRILR